MVVQFSGLMGRRLGWEVVWGWVRRVSLTRWRKWEIFRGGPKRLYICCNAQKTGGGVVTSWNSVCQYYHGLIKIVVGYVAWHGVYA